MFIHPTQARSLTPREAARVQTFPDWFHFPVPRTQQFRLIGNAVPPLVSEAVGITVREFLSSHSNKADSLTGSRKAFSKPRVRTCMVYELQNVARLDRRTLRDLPKEKFLCGW